MRAKEAIDRLEPEKWVRTSASEKLRLLEEVRENLKHYSHELARSDAGMKNNLLQAEVYSEPESLMATVVPIGNTLTACIDLYTSLARGAMPGPVSVKQVADNLYDIHVFPRSMKDKILYAERKDVLRVNEMPRQINPLEKPGGIIGVLGAGNYSSSLEMVKALFLENCAVVHKPHHLNESTDKIWASVMKPLVDYGAMSFCDAQEGRALTQDARLTKIYFTGGANTAKAIEQATGTELISECGGNNPCIVVPGERSWTEKELKHQAVQIATIAKLNGGAVCGRTQTILTSANWPQRDDFLKALRNALLEETPAAGTYYPGSKETASAFREYHPEAETIEPEGGKVPDSEFLLITGAEEGAYAAGHEAFCQIINEIPLETSANAAGFLPKAVEFCNEKLLGTLASAIIIDEETAKTHEGVLQQAITDLHYGGIAINTMPPFIFLSPYLTWGGNETGKELVSGHGNFGNMLCYENVEKSIMYDDFMSSGHLLNTNKQTMNELALNMAGYSLGPNWGNLFKMVAGALAGQFRGKDF